MGRPQRYDCDYFPFLVKEGKTFTLLRRRWPLEGIGFFTELCILLTRTPQHHLKVESDLDLEYLISPMGCETSKANEIIDLLCNTGKVHKVLWKKHRILVIPDLIDSLREAYTKRVNKIVSVEDMLVSASDTVVSGSEKGVSGVNPGSFIPKGEERIGEDSKEEYIYEGKKRKYGEFGNVLFSDAEYKTSVRKYGEPLVLRAIEILSNYKASKGKQYKSDYAACNSWAFFQARKDSPFSTSQPLQFNKRHPCPECGFTIETEDCPHCAAEEA